MVTCHLLRIPPELRLEIYGHLFPTQIRNYECIGNHPALIRCLKETQTNGAILRTCREIYNEALPVLYSKTTFEFTPTPLTGMGVSRSRVLKAFADIAQMKKVKIHIYLPAGQEDVEATVVVTKALLDKLDHCKYVQELELDLHTREGQLDRESKTILNVYKNVQCLGAVEVKHSKPSYPAFGRMIGSGQTSERLECIKA